MTTPTTKLELLASLSRTPAPQRLLAADLGISGDEVWTLCKSQDMRRYGIHTGFAQVLGRRERCAWVRSHAAAVRVYADAQAYWMEVYGE